MSTEPTRAAEKVADRNAGARERRLTADDDHTTTAYLLGVEHERARRATDAPTPRREWQDFIDALRESGAGATFDPDAAPTPPVREAEADALQGEIDKLADWQRRICDLLTCEGDRGPLFADLAEARIRDLLVKSGEWSDAPTPPVREAEPEWAGFPATGLEPRGCPTPGACSCPGAEAVAHVREAVAEEAKVGTRAHWRGPFCECGHDALDHLGMAATEDCKRCDCEAFVERAARTPAGEGDHHG